MLSYSPSVAIAWQIAVIETGQANLEFIEKEHIFIGLLKVSEVIETAIRGKIDLKIPEAELGIVREEILPLEGLFSHFGLDIIELRRSVRGLIKRGNCTQKERVIHRSEACKKCFKRADEIAMTRHAFSLRLLHVFEAIMEEPGEIIKQVISRFNLECETLREAASSMEAKETVAAGVRPNINIGEEKAKMSKTPFLDRFGVDLTRIAAEGKIDPLIGRREELLNMVRTLTRKTKNNPLLIGDAGVGKTAIVKGLALRVMQKNITPVLQNKRIIELNMGVLVAGTKYRGEFEERLVRIIDEAKKNEDIILFIDEIHTAVGAGSAEGSLDAANILKPALSGGEIRCIGATTLTEYRKYIEKDPALERRFQPVMVEEPTGEETLQILKGLKERYEEHHRVFIMPEALEAAVKYSVKYLHDRRLPDKALDVIDESCSRLNISTLTYHGKVEDCGSKVGQVTEEIVAKVVADWSGRPVEKFDVEEQERLSRIDEKLAKRVVGQDDAVKAVSQIIKMARSGLRDARKPTGVFLFLGPTGVGKTELAKALAEFLFGSEDYMIRLDMSEYMEKHNVARLVGAPPGYIGYDEEGQLTGKLRRQPYTVVLLDEIEKAHPEVLDIFLQVFDEGRLTDSKGRTIDAKDAIFIMTSNIGSDLFFNERMGFGQLSNEKTEMIKKDIQSMLKQTFRVEFLNRIDEIVFFRPLKQEDISAITLRLIDELSEKLKQRKITLDFKNGAMELLCKEGFDFTYGARHLRRTVERRVTKPLSEKLLRNEFKDGDTIIIDMDGDDIVFKKKDKHRSSEKEKPTE